MDLVELTKPGATKIVGNQTVEGTGIKYYVLNSLIPRDLYASSMGTLSSPKAASIDGLLAVVMSLITMSGGTIPEGRLQQILLFVHRLVNSNTRIGQTCDKNMVLQVVSVL